MLFLIGYVSPNRIKARWINRHSKILFLPRKPRFRQAVLIYPKRRFALYQLHYLIDRLVGSERNQTMDVVNISIDHVNMNSLCPGVFENMLKDPSAYTVDQQRLMVCGRPYEMYPDFYPRHNVSGNSLIKSWLEALVSFYPFPLAKASGNLSDPAIVEYTRYAAVASIASICCWRRP